MAEYAFRVIACSSRKRAHTGPPTIPKAGTDRRKHARRQEKMGDV